MGKFLMKMEQKYGKYAIGNLTMVLVFCYVVGYVLQMIAPGFMEYLYLNPYLVLKGQIWRLFTWIVVPTGSFSVWELLLLYCFYILGSNIEFAMGKFRYNLYIFSGMIFTVIGGFILYGIARVQYADWIELLGEDRIFTIYGVMSGEVVIFPATWFRSVNTSYVYMSLLLAFATIYPDATFRLSFLIPIKAKVLGIVYAVITAYSIWMGDVVSRVVIVASLLNFIIFFFATRDYRRISPAEHKRKAEYYKKVHQAQKTGNTSTHQGRTVITRHKCAICGRTELDDENLEFRFCSKCEGNYEYCSEHLYTHEHVRRIVPGGTTKYPEE